MSQRPPDKPDRQLQKGRSRRLQCSQTSNFLVILLAMGCVRSTSATQPPPASHPAAELEQLDPRTPLPLLPMMALHQKQNMRQHLIVIQDIVSALAAQDYQRIEVAAEQIATSPEMGRTCSHMGSAASGFTEQALAFHAVADQLLSAAREQNSALVLERLGETLSSCTSCHAQWQQQVVSDATWSQLTVSTSPTDEGSASPSHAH